MSETNSESEHWGDRHRPFPPAWIPDDHPDAELPVEQRPPLLRELAAAVVRGEAIENKAIPELRDLVEAVNQYIQRLGTEIVTDLVIRGGEIESCRCEGLVFGCKLQASTRFGDRTDFRKAKFGDGASFGGATFGEGASFVYAVFGDETHFDEVRFGNEAEFNFATFGNQTHFSRSIFNSRVCFDNVTFGDNLTFIGTEFCSTSSFAESRFNGTASFSLARFFHNANFDKAIFVGMASLEYIQFGAIARFVGTSFHTGVVFVNSHFSGDIIFIWTVFANGPVKFVEATIQRRLRLDQAMFGNGAGLALNRLLPLSGATIEISREQLEAVRPREGHAWWIGALCWPISMCLVILAAVPTALWSIAARDPERAARLIDGHDAMAARSGWAWAWKIADWFVRVRDRRLIWGEDSDDPDRLRMAADDYELLAANFRTQPARDWEEDHCRWRAHELRRVAKLKDTAGGGRWLGWMWHLVYDWFIRRVCLGYLLQVHRPVVAGLALIFGCAAIYYFGASEDTIAFNGRLWPGESAMDRWNEPEPWGRYLSPLWFSLTTFVTLGYGDFAPVGWFKLVSGLEALLGVTLLALFTVAWGRKMVR